MTNPNTNVVPAKSFGTDWSTVWSTTVAADYIVKKRIWLVLILLIVAYIGGCILHATGYGLINIIVGTIAMLTVIANAARPFTLAIFGLGGAVYAGTDKVVDVGPGVKAGLENLVRLANAVMMFIGLTFLLLGTWPLAVAVWMYALVPMGTALLVNILVYEKMASKGWVWKLFGTYIIALFVVGALGGIPIIDSIFGWVDDKQQELAANIAMSAANSTTETVTPAVQTPPKVATDNRSDLGDFDPIFLNPGQERVLIKYQDDALCYYPVSGLGVMHRFENENAWFPGFNNNAWAIKLKNTGSTRIEIQAWREAGTVCNSR